MQVPLIGGAYKEFSSNINAQRCINLFVHIDPKEAKAQLSLRGTPGLKEFSDLGQAAPLRGMYPFGSVIYSVCGKTVYSVTAAGVASSLGSLTTDSGNVFMDDNGTQVLIVDGTASGHYIAAGVLNDVALPCTATSVTFLDGYFIVTDSTNPGRYYISGLYDATSWAALDYATAERNSDAGLRVMSSGKDFWIYGTETAEGFYNSGASFPFAPLSWAYIEVGCAAAGSVVNVDGIDYWLTDKGQVVRRNGASVDIVSTSHVDLAISQFTTISDAMAYSYKLQGHTFYVITFPSHDDTWVYDVTTDFWHQWKSYSVAMTAEDSMGRHRSCCGIYFNRKYLVGDYNNGHIYELDADTYTDDGTTIRRIRRAQTVNKDRVRVTYHSLEIEFEAGTGLITGQGSDPQAMLRFSKDGGNTWSNERWVGIGAIGEYGKRAIWRRLGMARSMIFEVVVTDPVKVVMLGAFMEAEVHRT